MINVLVRYTFWLDNTPFGFACLHAYRMPSCFPPCSAEQSGVLVCVLRSIELYTIALHHICSNGGVSVSNQVYLSSHMRPEWVMTAAGLLMYMTRTLSPSRNPPQSHAAPSCHSGATPSPTSQSPPSNGCSVGISCSFRARSVDIPLTFHHGS